MKIFKISLLFIGLLAFISCNDANKSTSEGEANEMENSDMNASDENLPVLGDDSEIDEPITESDDQYIGSSTEKLNTMYRDLDMTQEQIALYENELKKAVKNQNDQNLDTEKLEMQQDKSLKIILSAEQYKKYEQWKKKQDKL